jgi:hypothetical protein
MLTKERKDNAMMFCKARKANVYSQPTLNATIMTFQCCSCLSQSPILSVVVYQ